MTRKWKRSLVFSTDSKVSPSFKTLKIVEYGTKTPKMSFQSKFIFMWLASYKLAFFMWLATHNKILTIDHLIREASSFLTGVACASKR